MNKTWQLQEAKNRFSEVVELALRDGPQVVTRHGEPTVVICSVAHYKRRKRKGPITHFLRLRPDLGVELAIERDRRPGRKIDL